MLHKYFTISRSSRITEKWKVNLSLKCPLLVTSLETRPLNLLILSKDAMQRAFTKFAMSKNTYFLASVDMSIMARDFPILFDQF